MALYIKPFMSLQILPPELLEVIGDFLSKTEYERFMSYDTKLTRTNKYKVFAINRIKLWFMITRRYRNMAGYIDRQLSQIFDNLHCAYRSRCCVYYAPHVPNGTCRFCMKYKKAHYFSPKFIEKFFILNTTLDT